MKKEYTVIWTWNDNSCGKYDVATKQDAEMMARQLYFNPDIISVVISDKVVDMNYQESQFYLAQFESEIEPLPEYYTKEELEDVE